MAQIHNNRNVHIRDKVLFHHQCTQNNHWFFRMCFGNIWK